MARPAETSLAPVVLPPGSRPRLVALLFGMNLINFVDRVNITIVAPVILADLGWERATLGTVMSATLLGYAAGQIPAGLIIDRFGAFWILASMCAAWSLATALTPSVFEWFSLLLIVRFLLGFFESVNNPGQTAINTRAFAPDELARAQGLCFAGTQVGPLLASPLIAWLVTLFHWSYIFYGCAVLGFVWVAAWIFFAPRLPSTSGAAHESRAPVHDPRGRPAQSWDVIRTRPVIALAGAGLFWGYSMWLFVSWFPTYLSEAWGLSMQQMGWVNTIPTFGGIAALLLGGVISDRLVKRGMAEGSARKRLACFGLLGSGGCILLAALAPNGFVAVAFFTLNGLIQGLAVAPFFSLPAVLAPHASATVAATANFCMALGGVVSPYLAGFLRDRTGDWLAPLATAGFGVFAAGLILLLLVRVEPISARRMPHPQPT